MSTKILPRALRLCAFGVVLSLGARAVPSSECAVLSLDRPVYNPGDTAVLSIEAAPGLIPFLFVSPDPDPVTTSPFGGRRLGTIPASGTKVLKRSLVTCEQPEKYMQVTLFDPETRRPVCVSNEVFLAIDRAGFCDGGEEPPCGPCDGKVSALTLRYNGDAPAGIEVFQKKVDDAIFTGTVPAGGLFSLIGEDKKGTLGTEIQIFVDGALAEKIHTSCSQPIGVGLIVGDFEVIAGASRNGGPLCPLDQPPPGEEPSDDLCEDGKPRCLTMVYTGSDCSATQSGQDDGKVKCEDSGALPASVVVEVRDKKGDKLYFLGAVDLGQAFVIDAGNAGDDKLKSATFVDIFDDQGNLLQSIEFHTSCSQPLALGDRFGALELVGFNAACN